MSLLNVLLVEVIESQELKSLYFVLLVLANPCKLKHLFRCNNCILILAQFFKEDRHPVVDVKQWLIVVSIFANISDEL